MPIGCTPLRMVYSKACHLPLNELMELQNGAYANTRIYKERTKRWHDSRLRGDKDFKNGDKVLLFNSRLKLHPGELKSKWSGPFIVKTMYLYGAVEITDENGSSFKCMRTRSKARRLQQQQQQVPPNLVEPPKNTMADNRTMAELLQAPTEGYEDAIVVPEIEAANFEIKHGLLNSVQTSSSSDMTKRTHMPTSVTSIKSPLL
ncbi:hypothetical protein Tco_1057689 [Tanacetum coccineum]|uniref:Uncharacterized protein n=1 Tax=Tanacetum coccineum TaxID=301880 RepID=A0ABQ5H7W2_9ASTR